jgi:long-subunit fatty acid transport protein
VGIKIQTPTILSIEEKFRILRESIFATQTIERDSRVYYDEPDRNKPPYKTRFDVTSPFQLSVGGSLYIENLLLSASSEFSDWTQMKFSDVPAQLQYLNTEIKERFRATLSYRAGAEYEFQDFPLSLRSGFMFFPSAYNNDPSSFAKKYVTIGAGYVLQDAFAIDIAYANGFWNSFTNAPNKGFTVQEKITTHTIFTTITYRY